MELFETCLRHTKSRIQPRFALMKGSASITSAELRAFAGMAPDLARHGMAVSCGHRDKLPGCGDQIQARLQSYGSGGGGSKVSLIVKQ